MNITCVLVYVGACLVLMGITFVFILGEGKVGHIMMMDYVKTERKDASKNSY